MLLGAQRRCWTGAIGTEMLIMAPMVVGLHWDSGSVVSNIMLLGAQRRCWTALSHRYRDAHHGSNGCWSALG
jgi:hypothetical protein